MLAAVHTGSLRYLSQNTNALTLVIVYQSTLKMNFLFKLIQRNCNYFNVVSIKVSAIFKQFFCTKLLNAAFLYLQIVLGQRKMIKNALKILEKLTKRLSVLSLL